MNIGETLKQAREGLGLSQQDVADAAGIKRSTYASYENSKSTPNLEVLENLAMVLGFNFQNKKEEPESKTIIKLYSSAVEYETNINDGTEHLSSDERMLLKYLEILDGDDRKNFLEEIKTKYIDAIVEKLQIK